MHWSGNALGEVRLRCEDSCYHTRTFHKGSRADPPAQPGQQSWWETGCIPEEELTWTSSMGNDHQTGFEGFFFLFFYFVFLN